MQCLNGKHVSEISSHTLATRLVNYHHVSIDVGTGDGCFVKYLAQTNPTHFVIGIDACREQLRATSRTAPLNALYVIANALALPDELEGCATNLSINFPWGSLLFGLVRGDSALLDGLRRLGRPGATLELRLNAGAFIASGLPLLESGPRVGQMLQEHGFIVDTLLPMDVTALRACPTTWAKRVAFSRNPSALYLRATIEAPRPLTSK